MPKPPKLLKLRQGSKDWHDLRRVSIGASDVPIILRLSSFSDPFKLWQLKTGQRKPDAENDATRHGNKLEPVIREWYEEKTGYFGSPAVLQMQEWPDWVTPIPEFLQPTHMLCSMDYYAVSYRRSAEFKAPFDNYEQHCLAKEGTIPEEHYPQVQTNLFVGGPVIEQCDYVSWWDGDAAEIPVTLNKEYVLKDILPALDRFMGWVSRGVFPLPEGEQEFTDPAQLEAGEKLRIAVAMRKEADRAYKKALAGVYEFAWPYRKSRIGTVEYVQTFIKGGPRHYTTQDYIKAEVKRGRRKK